MGDRKKLVLPSAAAVVVALGIAAYLYYGAQRPSETTQARVDTDTSTGTISAQISGAVESPSEKLPQTNPFSDYKNPF